MKKNNALNTIFTHISLFFVAFPGIYVRRIFLSHGKNILTINRICIEYTSINYWKGSKYLHVLCVIIYSGVTKKGGWKRGY